MRIIAGFAKGRKLFTPDNKTGKPLIRPTSDRAREALFSILGERIQDALVLDLFAGTGALGLEALSRGARHVVFVDRHPKAVDLIRRNIKLCGFVDNATLVKREIDKGLAFLKPFITQKKFNLVFVDPPYRMQIGRNVVFELGKGGIIAAGGIVVVEDYHEESMPDQAGELLLFDQRRYGDTAFWFYKPGRTS